MTYRRALKLFAIRFFPAFAFEALVVLVLASMSGPAKMASSGMMPFLIVNMLVLIYMVLVLRAGIRDLLIARQNSLREAR